MAKTPQWDWVPICLAARSLGHGLMKRGVMYGGVRRGDRSSSLVTSRNELNLRRWGALPREDFSSPLFCSFSLHSVPSLSSYALGKQGFGGRAISGHQRSRAGGLAGCLLLKGPTALKAFGLVYILGNKIY